MEYLIGAGLALAVAVCATLSGFDRDRSFYPTILVVIASTYDLFAAIGGSREALAIDGLVMAGFVGLSVIGFRTNLWVVVAGLFAHGMLDLVHGHLISNPGVPVWWPAFCMTYDVAAAAYLGWLLVHPGKARLQAKRASLSAQFAGVP